MYGKSKVEEMYEKMRGSMLNDFEKGVVYAAGLIVRMHDQPGMAAEILQEAGLDHRNFSNCDDFEKESLRKLQGERGLHLYGL